MTGATRPLVESSREAARPAPGTAAGAAPIPAHGHALLDRITETYWRYVARHELFLRLWERHRQPRPRYRVLEVGCGSGGLLAYLAARAPIWPVGVDMSPETLGNCRRRGLSTLSAADATQLPLRSASFDFVITQDVVEHVPDDAGLLTDLARVCVPGGLALVLAPAHRSLWSTRDVRWGHLRRYTLAELSERVAAAGFDVVRTTYTDSLLFPVLRAAVALAPRTREGVPDLPFDAPGGSGLANRLLLTLSRWEAAVALRARLPVGVSALVLGARRPS